MHQLTRLTVLSLTTAALALTPAAYAASSHSHRGQHGNHCGLGHVKHTHGIGRSCQKISHHHG